MEDSQAKLARAGMRAVTTLDELLDVATGFWRAKVLLSAVGFDLFVRLDGRPATSEEVATGLHLDDAAAFDFLNLLTSMGLLERSGEGPLALFRSSAVAARHLSTHDGRCVAPLLKVWNARSYRMWANLEIALRTGRQSSTGSSDDVLRLRIERLMGALNLSRHVHLCNVGGPCSLAAITAAQRIPHLNCTAIENPEMVSVARDRIAEAGLADRVRVVCADPIVDSLPLADLHMLTTVLGRLGGAQKRRLVRLAYEALSPQGVLVAIENWGDDDRCPNVASMLSSLSLLLELGEPSDPTLAEFIAWCSEAGFQTFDRIPLSGACAAAIAYKSAESEQVSVGRAASP